MASWSDASSIPRARISSNPSGSGVTSTKPIDPSPPAPGVHTTRSTASGRVERAQRLADEPLERREIGRRELEHARRLAEAAQVQVDAKRHARIDAHRLEGRPPAQNRLVVGAKQRLRWVDHAAAEHGQGKRGATARVRSYCG